MDAHYATALEPEVSPTYTESLGRNAPPKARQSRKGRAFFPDGKVRRVWAGIYDGEGIPAHGRVGKKYVRGYLSLREDGEFVLNILGGRS